MTSSSRTRARFRALGLLALGALLFVGAPRTATAKVRGKVVRYRGGGAKLIGYVAYDDASKNKRPGVLVVHEWWGHNKYVRRRARMLAKLGYVAMALDMYGGGQNTSHPKKAGAFAKKALSDFAKARARFVAALELLRKHPRVDSKRVAAIGYCFGGGVVINMALSGLDLRAIASFHGSLGVMAKPKPGAVKARMLLLHGAADPFVPPKVVAAFKRDMKRLGVKLRFVAYKGARHAFTNPGADAIGKKHKMKAIAYNKSADKKSWGEMKRFFAKVLR